MSANLSGAVAVLPTSLEGRTPRAGLSGYVPAIDGLRAISIGLVLLAHLLMFDQRVQSFYSFGAKAGDIGVSIFFVISGYLITGLLLREEDCNGRIDLGRFYGRRFLRIFPAAYTFLLVILVLAVTGVIVVAPHTYLASLLYIRNMVGRGHETAHLWSLAIEEQFYLLWPTALVLCAPAKRLRMVSLVVCAILPWRIFLVLGSHLPDGAVYRRTDLRVDTVLVGCVLALLVRTEGFAKWNSRLLSHPAVGWMSCFLVALASWLAARWPAFAGVECTIVPLAIGLGINSVLQSTDSWVGKFLRLPPVIFVGKLSYSLYLWQQLFLGPIENKMAPFRVFPINLILVFLFALFSYYLVEKPALRLKDRRFGVRRAGAGTIRECAPASEPLVVAAQGN